VTPGPLLLLAGAALGLSLAVGAWWSRTWLALTAAGAAAGLAAALWVLLGGGEWEWRPGWSPGGEMVHLRLDGLSAVFLALVAVAGLPPLNGFVSEWLVYLGLFGTVTSRDPSAGADLTGANLSGADLRWANLIGAIGL
jgi:formate hydrogenlyase subunit 3/multisubunit Na+/H+ antiporter MnhD subunit